MISKIRISRLVYVICVIVSFLPFPVLGRGKVAPRVIDRLTVFNQYGKQWVAEGVKLNDEPDFGGAKYVMSPPLRQPEDNEALWKALANGSLSIVVTDHCPFNFKSDKQRGRDNFALIPNGAPGIEHRLALLYTYGVATGRLSLNRFVEIFSTQPAKHFGLHPRKGAIAIGSDADLVVFDPTIRGRISASRHHQRVDYTPFEGFETIGAPTHILVNGEVVAEGGKFIGTPGTGRFLPRKPTSIARNEQQFARS